MTTNVLLENLIGEIERITKGMSLIDAKNRPAAFHGYAQGVPVFPVFQEQEEWDPMEEKPLPASEEELFPYFVVRISDMEYQVSDKDGEGNRATVMIVFAVFDDDPQLKGYYTLTAAVERVADRFQKNQALGACWCSRRMSVANQEDDTFPYFFAGLEMNWYLPEIEQEEMW